MGKEEEYREIFLAEALECNEDLNNLFTELEKNIQNRSAIDAIFRITHTLKGNAMGMGYTAIAELSHVIEDVFNEVKNGTVELNVDIFSGLFKANDILGKLINALTTGEAVSYKGVKTKLEIALKISKVNPVQNNEIANEHPGEIKSDNYVGASLSAGLEEITESEHDNEETRITISDVVQVPVRKLDALLNIIGELIIEKDTLTALNIERGYQTSDLARLNRITSDLQYGIMDVRLVQIGFLFNKFQRIVRDAAMIEKKKVELIVEGTEIEIDRNILKIMSDSLVHLVRNSVGHGIESKEKRKERNKPETGRITLRARNEKDTVFIEVTDDGNGIDVAAIRKKALEKGMITQEFEKMLSDEEAMMFIFEPGFSNTETVTEISGRGVGMDVVKRAVESIGGKIDIETAIGKGTTFTLSLPSSMAVKGALLFELTGQTFAIALTHTEAVLALRKHDIHKISSGLIANYLGKTISIIFLKDLFAMNELKETAGDGVFHHSFDTVDPKQKLDVVIVSYNKHLVGIVVDKLMQQKEIVEKTLEKPVKHVALFGGATILGDGSVCLVLDVAGLLSKLFRDKLSRTELIAN